LKPALSNSKYSGVIALSLAEFEQIIIVLEYTLKYKVLSNNGYSSL